MTLESCILFKLEQDKVESQISINSSNISFMKYQVSVCHHFEIKRKIHMLHSFSKLLFKYVLNVLSDVEKAAQRQGW